MAAVFGDGTDCKLAGVATDQMITWSVAYFTDGLDGFQELFQQDIDTSVDDPDLHRTGRSIHEVGRSQTVSPHGHNGGESSRGSEGPGPVTIRQPAAVRHRWQRQER